MGGYIIMEMLNFINIFKCKEDLYKGDYGKILLIGGSVNLGGVIMLVVCVCVFSGSGLIIVVIYLINYLVLYFCCLEVMVIDINDMKMLMKMIEMIDSILIGLGFGVDFKGNNVIIFLL